MRQPVFGFHVRDGIIIVGLSNAGNRGIKIVAVYPSRQFLNHHPHFFVFRAVNRAFDICSGAFKIGRSIHQFDGQDELF